MTSIGAGVVMEHERAIEDYRRIITEQSRRMLGGRRPDGEGLAGVVAGLLVEIDHASANALAGHAGRGETVGCRAGCAFCCFQEVTVSTAELALIAFGLRKGDRARVIERARATLARTGEGGSTERHRRSIPCPLQHGNRCAVYAIRPQACRTHFSLDRKACEAEWDNRAKDVAVSGVPMPTAPKAIGFAAMSGLDVALHELGLEIELVELAAGLPVLLAEGALERWLAGERLFREAMTFTADGHRYSDYLELLRRGE
jgi:Fe-S-cluster containining protein